MGSNDQLQVLVRRCQRGEQTAFEELFRRFQPRLRYYIRRLDAGGDRTEDTLQDVWVKVVRGIGALKDRKAFIAWLYSIARNEVYARAKMKNPFVELYDEDLKLVTDNHEPAFRAEEAARIHAALDKLKPQHREILTLCFLEELSHKEIAGILDIRAGTVKSRIHYAKRSLRQELEKNHG